jgi:hypothetical protein
LAYRDSHDLNDSNRPVRTRMPGGVAGDRSATLAAPMPISHEALKRVFTLAAGINSVPFISTDRAPRGRGQ